MDFNPEISLKMANSLLSEVIEEIEPFHRLFNKSMQARETRPFCGQ